ncbi:hypothetical protein F4859DRAFT_511840 [Xylaria cf. heliscus]|nr:hypothetical protein F4859DRAFT_511840 [Xylaria cf. heliscus]
MPARQSKTIAPNDQKPPAKDEEDEEDEENEAEGVEEEVEEEAEFRQAICLAGRLGWQAKHHPIRETGSRAFSCTTCDLRPATCDLVFKRPDPLTVERDITSCRDFENKRSLSPSLFPPSAASHRLPLSLSRRAIYVNGLRTSKKAWDSLDHRTLRTIARNDLTAVGTTTTTTAYCLLPLARSHARNCHFLRSPPFPKTCTALRGLDSPREPDIQLQFCAGSLTTRQTASPEIRPHVVLSSRQRFCDPPANLPTKTN